uniref:Uncharacterized protein n=1 Tax=Physcomitrium patens TaxID=3218 RepID=A0A2K1ICX0_PHYPA|nr:hypothetical protein PHYPA_030598 [Physcomitrium patens]
MHIFLKCLQHIEMLSNKVIKDCEYFGKSIIMVFLVGVEPFILLYLYYFMQINNQKIELEIFILIIYLFK